jgi:hypothetical protein
MRISLASLINRRTFGNSSGNLRWWGLELEFERDKDAGRDIEL